MPKLQTKKINAVMEEIAKLNQQIIERNKLIAEKKKQMADFQDKVSALGDEMLDLCEANIADKMKLARLEEAAGDDCSLNKPAA